MNKIKKAMLSIGLLFVMVLTAGCTFSEEKVTETVSELKETPVLPSFIPEPEKIVTEVNLPDAYNYMEEGRMPVLRNQGDNNTCWAYASLSALEASKDEDGKGPYSAEHLIYQNPFEDVFANGGAYVVTSSYVLSWEGPVFEEGVNSTDAGLKELSADVHVQEIRQSEPKDYEAIKKFLYCYGAVESALYVDFDEYMIESSYYNEEHNSYCYTGEQVSNHDVVIVGWDDHYPAENFVGDIEQDGAFLCQNSWGDAFGDHGTFYVSYEDVNIGGYGVVYSRIDPLDNYDLIYQADLCGFTAQIGYNQEEAWFANVYTADQDIALRAAGFYATGKNTEYEIYAVSNFENKSSLKNKLFICNGFLEDGGYYTIDFPKEVLIKAGNEFAIIVKIKTENAIYPVAIECPVDGLSENADMSDGKGFLSLQGTIWEHIEETKNYNICLKGYADLL